MVTFLIYLKIILISVFARDDLPTPMSNSYYIINLDDGVGVGTHWVARYVRGGGKSMWFFDSFGISLLQ